MTLEEFKNKYPDIAKSLILEGDAAGYDRGFKDGEAAGIEKASKENQDTAKAAGATQERERIKSVQDQLIPGHETLIRELMFDGNTSGPEAAVKILAAEKKLRTDILVQHQADAPDILPDPSTDNARDIPTKPDDKMPVGERAKAVWDKDPKLRLEFEGDYEAYLAFEKANSKGQVKILRGKDSAQ